jgi:hypothetical protein
MATVKNYRVIGLYGQFNSIQMSHKSEDIGELGYLAKYWANVKDGKLLQIMCFQTQVFEFYT